MYEKDIAQRYAIRRVLKGLYGFIIKARLSLDFKVIMTGLQLNAQYVIKLCSISNGCDYTFMPFLSSEFNILFVFYFYYRFFYSRLSLALISLLSALR